MSDITEKLRADALHSEKATGEPKETWLSWVAADEIERLRTALKDIQREAMTLKPPRHSWYYDRAQNALANTHEPLVRDGLAPAHSNGDRT